MMPHQANGTCKFTPYYTYVDDYIDAARCSSANSQLWCCEPDRKRDSFVYLQFVNQSAEIYGVDLSSRFPSRRTYPVGDFSLTGLLVSYTRGKNETTDDNLYNIMPLNAKLAMVQSKNGWTNTLELELVDAKTDVSAVRNEA